eukprot:5834870-Pyramimonas_sp.AAC.1
MHGATKLRVESHVRLMQSVGYEESSPQCPGLSLRLLGKHGRTWRTNVEVLSSGLTPGGDALGICPP